MTEIKSEISTALVSQSSPGRQPKSGSQLGAFTVAGTLPDSILPNSVELVGPAGGPPMVATSWGRSLLSSEKQEKAVTRLKRILSWHQDATMLWPSDFIFQDDQLYTVSQRPSPTSLISKLESPDFKLSQLVQWVFSLTNLLIELHEARQPFFLKSLPIQNCRVTEDGKLQLLGVQVSPELKLGFGPLTGESPIPPDSTVDARTDLWCLGMWIRECLKVANKSARQELRQDQALSQLFQSLVADSPEQRPGSASVLRGRLEVARRTAPEVGSLRLDEVNQHLAKHAAQPWLASRAYYRDNLMLAVACLVIFLIGMNFAFPAKM